MIRKFNLLVDAHGFDGHFQGSRSYIAGLYKALIPKAEGIHFFLAAYDVDALTREFGLHQNVSFVKLKSRRNLVRLSFDIPRLIRKYDIDCTHFQYAVPFIKTSKEIVTIHDVLFLDYPRYFPFLYRLIREKIFKISAQRADLLLTVSNYAKQSISLHLHVPEEKIHVLPNGIDNSFLVPSNDGEASSSPYILYVSRWEPRKNHFVVLKAFLELGLHKRGYKLVFIGKKDIREKIFEIFWKTLPEHEKQNVEFLESVSQKDLITFYRKSSLFVYPSIAEGFGIPPLEAAAAAVPVLCSNRTAMSDFTFFKDSLFDPENTEELKQKIKKILVQKDEKLLQAIRSHVIKNYDWEKIADDYLGLLSAAIRNWSASGSDSKL